MNHNHTVILLNIPIALQQEVLGSWLTIKDVAKLDSAICCRETRPMFLELLAMKDLVLINRDIAISKVDSWMVWIVAKKVRINHCQISKAFVPALYMPFFTCAGKRLETLTITGKGEHEIAFSYMMSCAAPYCTNLKEISLKKCLSVRGFENLLWISQGTLIKLSIDDCNLTGFQVCGFKFPSLKRLRFNDCTNITSATLKELLQAAPNLIIFVADKVNVWPAGLVFSQYLRMVSINSIDFSDYVLSSLVHSCPLLEVVDLGNCPLLTDVSVIELVQHAKHLNALYLCSNNNFTDTTMEAIAVNCGERLKHLAIFNCVELTDTGLNHISEVCHALLGLSIGGLRMQHITAVAIQALLQSNPLLQEVSVCWNLGNAVLTTLAAVCPHLRYLDLYELKGYTELGISAISRCCTQLRTMAVNPNCTVINPLSRDLLKRCCPGLEFLFENKWLPFWPNKFTCLTNINATHNPV